MRKALSAILAAGLLAVVACGKKAEAPAAAAPAPAEPTAEQKAAFDTAIDAYVFGYPLVTMDITRRVMTNVAAPEGTHAPMGQFVRMREYPNASFRDVTAPNADTLYTTTWLDVSKEPWVLSLPDMKGRYYLFADARRLDRRCSTCPASGRRGPGRRPTRSPGRAGTGTLPAGVKEYKVADRTSSGCSAASTAPARPRTTRPCTRSRTSIDSCR